MYGFVTRYMGIETRNILITGEERIKFVTRYMGIETRYPFCYPLLIKNLLLAIWVLKQLTSENIKVKLKNLLLAIWVLKRVY